MSTTTVVCERNNNAGDAMEIQQGSFVEIRGRQWLVEAVDDTQPDLTTLRLSCIADDAQGEQIEVLWDAEIGAKVIQDDTWSQVGRGAPDSPEVLAAYLRAIRWRSATAADRDLLQAPFRAGIRLDHYQLLPLRKALRLPRVNLLIADDVGLGKTVEAGLVVRELLLRRRIDLIVISPPPAMLVQWKDELESKFGLTFDIIDRERVGELRRRRGFTDLINRVATRAIDPCQVETPLLTRRQSCKQRTGARYQNGTDNQNTHRGDLRRSSRASSADRGPSGLGCPSQKGESTRVLTVFHWFAVGS
jgi:hypothetical protein